MSIKLGVVGLAALSKDLETPEKRGLSNDQKIEMFCKENEVSPDKLLDRAKFYGSNSELFALSPIIPELTPKEIRNRMRNLAEEIESSGLISASENKIVPMKHIKIFESFINEDYHGKWKVETWGKFPGSREWEMVDVQPGFASEEEANKYVEDKSKENKALSYDVSPEEGWIDPAGTWHPDSDGDDDDDFYDPASAYENDQEWNKLDTNTKKLVTDLENAIYTMADKYVLQFLADFFPGRHFREGEDGVEEAAKAIALDPSQYKEVLKKYPRVGQVAANAYVSESVSGKVTSIFSDVPPSMEFKTKDGKKVELREVDGHGMADEPMTFAYLFLDGVLTKFNDIEDLLNSQDALDLKARLDDINDENQASAISYVI